MTRSVGATPRGGCGGLRKGALRMFNLGFDHFTAPIRHVLCLGAHCDDLEIGCGGTVLRLVEGRTPPAFTWVIFSSDPVREAEALRAAEALLQRAASAHIVIKKFRDGFLPYEGSSVKEVFEELKHAVSPDLILTHYRGDLHQDHRLISDLTWNTFRRPSHPGVRNPEVRRRSRNAEPLRAARRGPFVGGRSTPF